MILPVLTMPHIVALAIFSSLPQNIPTVAEFTQGEVINFAGAATSKLCADGYNVLMEGRAPTLQYVRSPHRFELTLRVCPNGAFKE